MEIYEIQTDGILRVHIEGPGIDILTWAREISYESLLSRKTPRTLSKSEAESLLKEKLGEEVLITNE